MATRSRAIGFTLIELLLSVAIMGLVIGIATYSFSLFTRHWDGRSWGFDAAIGSWQRLDLVVSALNNSLPWLVYSEKGELGYYFLGRDEGVTFISDSPVFAQKSAAVIRLFREQQVGGKWRLVYEEAPLSSQSLRRANQRLPFNRRMVVLSDLDSLSFEYFGWASIEDKGGGLRDSLGPVESVGGVARWWTEYDGMERFQHPLRIALLIDNHRSVFDFPDRSDSALQVVRAD
jgi:prepilin-type N-terminal cleavage/methylation domain-containing protein